MTEVARPSEEHAWVPPRGPISWEHCETCLVIRRADGGNGPCKGAGRLRPMEKPLKTFEVFCRDPNAQGRPFTSRWVTVQAENPKQAKALAQKETHGWYPTKVKAL